MVSRFRRTLSFPAKAIRPSPQEKSYHVRSVSLPCRSHPLISQLQDEINHLKTWLSNPQDRDHTSSWLCQGLIMLKNLHDSVDDLLQLPKTQESLTRKSKWVESLLDEFLRFVDAYGIFRAALVTLKEELSAAQVATRRRDEPKISLYVKQRKKMDKEMKKLVSTVRCIRKNENEFDSDVDVELAGVLRDVNEVTVLVTVAILNGISGASTRCKACIGLNLLKKNEKGEKEGGIREFEEVEVETMRSLGKKGEEEVRRILKKLQGLENSIGMIESESQRVFRSLINTRVSLLNIVTG